MLQFEQIKITQSSLSSTSQAKSSPVKKDQNITSKSNITGNNVGGGGDSCEKHEQEATHNSAGVEPLTGTGNEEDEKGLSKAEQSLLQKVVRKGLIVSKHDIEVQRKDPSSPLYSVKTFEALHL